MRYGQLVIGPAGSGKSTYCSAIAQHAASCNKTIEVVNLDPAAEFFTYDPIADVRELIHVDDAMEDVDLKFGPNGGLIFCMEYLLENHEWLREKLGDVDDDYILFDCPGQIELYTHMTTIKHLVDLLQNWNFHICAVFLIDAQFMVDGAKFISGTMSALSVMVNLELPHVNILSKMDLLSKSAKSKLENFLDPDPHYLIGEMESSSKWNLKYRTLTECIGRIIDDYSLVRFFPLNIKDNECISDLLLTIDNIIQYGEEADVRTRDFDPPEPENEDCD
ncbi:GPN-loop GTPase 3 [Halyomorpha halys]|uniref:GPN-loop GTPase 3 n=1 Tax=Halyomorpha halys TaxID=286706 RepID=UPI0006D4D322|nr:GPN-loop GTPase 3 [Halyomorpha halys]